MELWNKIRNALRLESRREYSSPQDRDGAEEKSRGSPYGRLLNLPVEEKHGRVRTLTPREYELFLLLLQGFTLKESAQQLAVKYSTANTHMSAVYKKLGVGTRAELILNYRDIPAEGCRNI